ncbi:aminodeoxychorismate/anthranilate synthase component II [Clostridium sp. 19966]|uniref:anthranilate synthase component II n=1 Tax=Clostridium sp. 19966 TaxID=2768166 RepID=UPI0028DF2F6D|nr:aminodeoxychorismate/anthranilate synthase component II [Clostridium sp. 19966]MDT8717093.1 aminodeoxychorismate/anthranilate synthase component II [Clostridium sp. 19966]
MIAIIDNYDSFVYNLYQYFGEFTEEIEVFRNDEITVEELKKLKPRGIVLSPGPGRPERAGICIDVINSFKGEVPILGICLGHQAIGCAFGGNIVSCSKIFHGKTSVINVYGSKVFEGIPNKLEVMRYHSLIIDRQELPGELQIIADTDGIVMGVKHRNYDIYGLQFHPESIKTSNGKAIIKNFVRSVCNV